MEGLEGGNKSLEVENRSIFTKLAGIMKDVKPVEDSADAKELIVRLHGEQATRVSIFDLNGWSDRIMYALDRWAPFKTDDPKLKGQRFFVVQIDAPFDPEKVFSTRFGILPRYSLDGRGKLYMAGNNGYIFTAAGEAFKEEIIVDEGIIDQASIEDLKSQGWSLPIVEEIAPTEDTVSITLEEYDLINHVLAQIENGDYAERVV